MRRHRDELALRGAFFSVSLARLLGDSADDHVARFARQTGWTPALAAKLDGALPFTRFGAFTWLMRLIGKRHLAGADTTRDLEYTNWGDVDRFAIQLAMHAKPASDELFVSPMTDEEEQGEMVWPAS